MVWLGLGVGGGEVVVVGEWMDRSGTSVCV